MSGFTPGPWEARVSDGQWVVARDRGDVLVASCGLAGAGYLTPAADARLIAAAPELYDALDAAELLLCQISPRYFPEGPSTQAEAAEDEATRIVVMQARAALAKARGDQDGEKRSQVWL